MAITNVTIIEMRPTAEGSVIQWQTSGSATHYLNIDDVVTQPTVSGTGTYNWADTSNDDDIDEIILGTTSSIPFGFHKINRIDVWFLCQDASEDGITLRVNLKVDGSWVGEQSFIPTGGTFGWSSLSFSGNWPGSAINNGDLQVRYQAEAAMTGSEEFQIAVVYADIYAYPHGPQMF